MRSKFRRAIVLASFALALLGFARVAGAEGPGAKALEARLLAPCCWNGTLDMHDSELAQSLRREIEERAGRGESIDAIEADMLGRYGARMRGLPNAGALSSTVVALFAAIAAGAIGIGAMVVRWRRNSSREAHAVRGERDVHAVRGERDAYDVRLDAELRDLD